MRPPRYEKDFLVSLVDVATACGVEPSTPRVWRARGVLPPSDMPELPEPAWWASTLAEWAAATGRQWHLDALLAAVAPNVERELGRPAAAPEQWRQRPVWKGGRAMAGRPDLALLGRPLGDVDMSAGGLCTQPI